MKNKNIIKFLKELKHSYHKNELIYTEGSCFRLYSILKTVFEDALPYYSTLDGHWIIKIDGRYYDINGEIWLEYIINKEYTLIEDEITLTSAYIPTYKRQCSSYSKYSHSKTLK